MAKQIFQMEYEFVSARAEGNNYSHTVEIPATNYQAALSVAKIVGFDLWGARFTENCIDWRIKGS